MIDVWFEDWLDIEVIDKKEENEIHNNDNGLSDTNKANNNDTGVLHHI
jgi:hypothetical protein